MKAKAILFALLLTAAATQAQANNCSYPRVLHQMYTQHCRLEFSTQHSRPGTLAYQNMQVGVLVDYKEPNVTSIGVIIGPNANPQNIIDVMAYTYLAFQSQSGKQMSNDRMIAAKLYRIWDTIKHNCKLTGSAKFSFDDMVISATTDKDNILLTMTPLFF
jgi:hypothetical protein